MTFEFRAARRENVGLLLSLASPSGAGKTMSAMKLAKGICGQKRFAMIDTEARRSLHYADQFDFDFVDLKPPFTPMAYMDAIEAAERSGYEAIITDSFSHEHAGEGGVLDWQEAELAEMVARALGRAGENRKEWELQEAYKRAAWIKPKAAHKRLVQRLLQCRSHLIFCLRAEDKIDFVKDEKTKKTKVVPMETLSGYKGWIPICDKRFLFEMTASFILLPDRPGVPIPIKLQEQHKPFFPLDRPITEEAGRKLAEWAKGGQVSGVATGVAGGSADKGPGSPQTPEPTLDADDIRDLETHCEAVGIRFSSVVDQCIKQGYKSPEAVPKSKKSVIDAWIEGRRKTA